MRSAFAVAALASLAGIAFAAGPATSLRPSPPPPHAGDTRCGLCHTTEGWGGARFPHEKTGFPLTGRHVGVSCKACHPAIFKEVSGRECAACHRDPHGGKSGRRCGTCHDAETWATTVTADAHRRTNFPLSGRHALIPCEECHGDRRDRAFARPTVECIGCHQGDFARTSAGAVDHVAWGFPTTCRDCHTPWRFAPAFFPAHEVCFPIAAGVHSGIRCLACHTTLAGATISGTCTTGTADCIRCHSCATHPAVAGFQCVDLKCYQCHRFGTVAGGLRLNRVMR